MQHWTSGNMEKIEYNNTFDKMPQYQYWNNILGLTIGACSGGGQCHSTGLSLFPSADLAKRMLWWKEG